MKKYLKLSPMLFGVVAYTAFLVWAFTMIFSGLISLAHKDDPKMYLLALPLALCLNPYSLVILFYPHYSLYEKFVNELGEK